MPKREAVAAPKNKHTVAALAQAEPLPVAEYAPALPAALSPTTCPAPQTVSVHAGVVARAAHAHPSLAQQPLLQLQKRYGNQHVQRVLALARQATDNAPVEPDVEQDIEHARGGGQTLDQGVRGQMESAFGADFGGVRVHTDTRADSLNQTLNARAFTTGRDIFFRQSAYSPGSSSGRELIAHELTHVVQQTGATHAKLVVNQPGDRFEQEADQAARAVIQREQQTPSIQRQVEEEETVQAKRVQRQAEEEEPVQATRVQRQAEEDESVQAKLVQRQMEEDKPVQAKLVQRQAEDDEPVQAKLIQRQAEDDEPVQAKLIQRQSEEDKPVQTKLLQRQTEEDESVQAKLLQRQAEDDEPLQTKLIHRQPEEDDKRIQTTLIQRRKASSGTTATLAYREGDEVAADEPTEAEKEAALAAARSAEQQAMQSLADGNNEVVKSRTAEAAEQTAEKTAQQEAEAQSPEVPAEAAYAAAAQPGGEEGEQPAAAAPGEMPDEMPAAEAPVPTAGKAPMAVTGAGPGAFNGKAPATPAEDPDYQAVMGRVKGVAHQQQKHAPAKAKAAESQAAAESPSSELAGKAQANQVDAMEQAEAPPFDAAAFKAQLMERIAALAPKTVEEADNFKKDNKIGGVKSEMQGRVAEEQNASAAPLAETTAAPPDTSSVEPKPVTPLSPAAPGPAPADVGATGAAPKSKGQGEVEAPLQENSQKLDQQMAEADVTEEQLANSNEPEFQTALGAKHEAQSHATSAPQEYRQAEGEQLTQAQAEAAALAQDRTQAMHGDRGQLFGQVAEQQGQTKSKDEDARAKVAADIQKIYDETKTNVEKILSELDGKVEKAFDEGAAAAKQAFEDYVEAKMDAYKERRYGGWFGWAKWAKDKLLGMPDEVNAFYADGRTLYLRKMDAVIDNVVAIIGADITAAQAEIAHGKLRINEYVEQLPEDLQSVGKQAAEEIQDKFADLQQSVADKQNELVDTLANKYQENLQAIDARIEEMKAANQGLVDKALNAVVGVIKAILKLIDLLLSVLARIAEVVGKIIKAPIEFLGNLIRGIKDGFNNFLGNIGKHLQVALVAWLTGALGPMNIQVPDDLFSLSGIFSLVTQVLGLTWDYIRAKAVKLLGEPVVKALETGFEVFQILIRDGPLGLWEFVKEQFTDLKEMVIDQIQEMVTSEVIAAGVKWILGLLNPAGAFIKAAMAIYEIVKFFVERGSQVIEMVTAFIDAVAAIAGGAVSGAAKLVEEALAKALPVVIGFLASLLGISGLAKKVQKLILRVRKKIDKAIDKLILKAKKAARKLIAKGKKALGKGEDVRSDKEKQADLKKAAEEAEKVVEDEKIPLKQVHKQLKTIRKKYGLTDLQLVEKQQTDKKIIYNITAEINPKLTLPADRENKFDELLSKALKTLGDQYAKGYSKSDIQSGKARQEAGQRDLRGSAATGTSEARSPREIEQEALGAAQRSRAEQVEKEGNRIHQELAKAQIAYSTASQAEYYPNNTFKVGQGNFFVAQINNYYIVPTSQAKHVWQYYITARSKKKPVREVLKDKINALKDELDAFDSNIKNVEKTVSPEHRQAAVDRIKAKKIKKGEDQASLFPDIAGISQSSDQRTMLDYIRERAKEFQVDASQKLMVDAPNELTKQYDYGRNPLRARDAKRLYKDFPESITGATKPLTIFVASVVAEPTRHSVAHLTNMLLLDERSELPHSGYKGESPPKVKRASIYNYLSMTQKGSDPADTAEAPTGAKAVPPNVAARDLAAVKMYNPQLHGELKKIFEANESNEALVVSRFIEAIKAYLFGEPSQP